MLYHPTLDKLRTLKLMGMARALEDQSAMSEIESFTFEERLGLLLDYESTLRDNKALEARLRRAKLKLNATPEDVDFKGARGIDKAAFMALLDTQWVKAHRNVLITGPTGVGKTYLACALANQVCRHGYSVLYCRMPRLFPLLSLAKVDGRYAQLLAQYAKVDVLLLDDWGLAPMTSEARHDLLEILDDRHDRKSTIVTSQLPVEHWHDAMGEATLADAILDRVVHNAHMIKLTGESQRKKRSKID
jgi:DNA replication protein DnaC